MQQRSKAKKKTKVRKQAYLRHQDSNNDTQLVQGAKGSSQGSWRDFSQVHRGQTSAETAENTYDQSTNDDHLKGATQRRQSHQTTAQQSQAVRKQHRFSPGYWTKKQRQTRLDRNL